VIVSIADIVVQCVGMLLVQHQVPDTFHAPASAAHCVRDSCYPRNLKQFIKTINFLSA